MVTTCVAGVCGTTFEATGVPIGTQIPGDCHVNECDGLGNVISFVDNTDVPADSDPCTKATCTAGVPSTSAVAMGTACGAGLVCNATGMCVGCLAATTCPGTDTECQTRTCTGGMCGFNFAAAGTPAVAQTPGDCHVNQCDGIGHVTSVVDNTDLPPSTGPCTTTVCTAGTPSNPPVSAGAACNQGGGILCNGLGACVACLLPTDCSGADTACRQRTCTAGACGASVAAAGTVTATQTAGDCHTNECDGAGNVVSVVDDTDVPASGSQCAPGVCTAGVPSAGPAPAGTPCNQGGGTQCNGTGACVGCVLSTDCPGTDTDCHHRTCTAGACGTSDAAAGTLTTSQTVGDCHSNACDGAGNVVVVVDNTDVPASSNACVPGSCTAGVPSTTTPAKQGTACAQNGGALCDGQGTCTQTYTVVRVGAAGGTLAGAPTATFLDTYYPLVGAVPVSTVALPTAAAGSEQPLTLSGTATSEGGLSRSADGRYLTLAGYAVAPSVGGTTTGASRVVGRVDATGAADTSTTLAATAFAGSNVRGATSVDGTSFWVSGTASSSANGGVWYLAFGATAGGTQITDTPSNMRMVDIFGGQLYGTSGSGSDTTVLAISSAASTLPTMTGATATPLPGLTATGKSPYGFVLLGASTLYIADSSTGISRWTLSGTTWTQDTTFTVLTSGCLGVTGWTTPTGVTLIVTTTGGTVQRIDVPSTSSPTATLLVTEATGTAFRGVALAAH